MDYAMTCFGFELLYLIKCIICLHISGLFWLTVFYTNNVTMVLNVSNKVEIHIFTIQVWLEKVEKGLEREKCVLTCISIRSAI